MNRKIRKLRRDPKLFLRDMITKRINKPNALQSTIVRLGSNKINKGRFKYAVVSAVYNVEKYLDAYFRSITRQFLDFKRNIKIVLVDDGSIDGTREIISRWSEKFPDNIFYIFKENGGQASARNAGIDFLESRFIDIDYITFIDPDDFVDLDYFGTVDAFIARNRRSRVCMVGCNLIFYDDATGGFRDHHPLRYRFAKGDVLLPMPDIARYMQLSAATAFFDLGVIVQNQLRFHENIRPSFEDAHFVARYMAYAGEGAAAFLKGARYFYRKRNDGSSTLDKSVQSKGLYLDVLRYGCIDLIDFYRARNLAVPKYVQRKILYHTCNYFVWNGLINNPERAEILNEEERAEFIRYLDDIFEHIDDDVIIDFELAGVWFYHKVGILNCFKNKSHPLQIVYFDSFDKVKNQVQIRYFCGMEELEEYQIDGRDISPIHATTVRHDFLDRTFVLERRVWLPLSAGDRDDSLLRVFIGGSERTTRLSLGGKQHSGPIKLTKIREHFLPKAGRSDAVRAGYDFWIMMDRDTQADDNAEHFYRYVRKNYPLQSIKFVLRRDSHDWLRLEREGFDLLVFGSAEHERALRECSKIISSHVDRYVVDYFRDGSLASKQYIFLQHGVTKDDLSSWLNTKNIDCLVTTSQDEFKSIASDFNRYKFTRKEVALTGFPRHDSLLARQSELPTEKIILIMPTWRNSLAGKAVEGNKRELNSDFMYSDYAVAWGSLLESEKLKLLATQAGYRVFFFPHANVQPYLKMFDIPNFIEVIGHNGVCIQDIFCKSSIMITDYSSVAFEMAFLKKPAIYYQFDKKEFFSGGHIFQKGYFDYEEDGFGPICTQEEELLNVLDRLIKQHARPDAEYLSRMESFFEFRDGGNCERVYQAIRVLDDPQSVRPDLNVMQKHALAAENAERWELAERRWRELLLQMDDSSPIETRQGAQRRLVHALAMQDARLLEDLRAGLNSPDEKAADIINLNDRKTSQQFDKADSDNGLSDRSYAT